MPYGKINPPLHKAMADKNCGTAARGWFEIGFDWVCFRHICFKIGFDWL